MEIYYKGPIAEGDFNQGCQMRSLRLSCVMARPLPDAWRFTMKELVEVIAKALVENPDEVVVTETEKEEETLIELKVAPSDMGKVIGKQGRIAKAIRSVVKAAASKEDKKVVVDIQ